MFTLTNLKGKNNYVKNITHYKQSKTLSKKKLKIFSHCNVRITILKKHNCLQYVFGVNASIIPQKTETDQQKGHQGQVSKGDFPCCIQSCPKFFLK